MAEPSAGSSNGLRPSPGPFCQGARPRGMGPGAPSASTGVCWGEGMRKWQWQERQRAVSSSPNDAKDQTGAVEGRWWDWVLPALLPWPQPQVSSFCYFRASRFPEASGFPARWGQGRQPCGCPLIPAMGLTFSFSRGCFFLSSGEAPGKQWAGNQGWGLPSRSWSRQPLQAPLGPGCAS